MDFFSIARQRLIANTQFWIDPQSGNDNNDGLTGGTAWATLQKFADFACKRCDTAGFSLTAQLFRATNAVSALFDGPILGGGNVVINGNVGAPTSIGLSRAGGDLIVVQDQAHIQVQGLGVTTTGSGGCLVARQGGIIDIDRVDFGACAGSHMDASSSGSIGLNGNYSISGGAVSHIHANNQGAVNGGSRTVTVNNNPAFSAYYAGVSSGIVQMLGFTFVGTATGPRFSAGRAGQVRTDTENPLHLPGSQPGLALKSGVYDQLTNGYRNISTDHTIDIITDHTLLVDASGGNRLINLRALNISADMKLVVKKIDNTGNTVTIDPSGAETIDGAANVVLTAPNASTRIQAAGTKWMTI